MTKYLLVLLLFLPAFASAQKTKKVTVKNESEGFIEKYYVLKSDQTIKHGTYVKMDSRKNKIESGFYKLGERDSIWTEYGRWGGNKKTAGHYTNEQKSGPWEFYDHQGKVIQRYDYTTKEVVFDINFEDEEKFKYPEINGTDTTWLQLDQPPVYIGGDMAMFQFIGQNLEYPALARENNIQGRILISFDIDETGKAVNIKVDKGIGWGCDEAALKVIQDLPAQWFPAKLNGKPIRTHHVVPIRFVLG